MAGSPTFSTEAADTLVTAYLVQPEGNKDLRRVLAAAKQRQLLAYPPGAHPVPADPSIQAEIAAMSQSQAYELLRADSRYQPTTTEQAEELGAQNLELAREIIAHEQGKPAYKRDIHRLREAQRLVHQVQWGQANVARTQAKHHSTAQPGLSSLLG